MQRYIEDLFISRTFSIIILVITIIATVICLIDAWRNEFHGNEKMFWVVLILLAPLAGALAYWVFGRKRKLN